MDLRWRRKLAIVAIAISWGTAVSCSSNDDLSPPDTTPTVSSTQAPAISDGVFRIGLLVPQSGPGATLGEPLISIVSNAVAEINATGGILGQDIVLSVRDEGPDAATATVSIDDFLADDRIDALIGPLSSSTALGVLPRLIENNIGVCSPTATAATLASFPDNGLFVRTTPSDTLASQAMAQLIAQTGVIQTSVAYPDDPFGRKFLTELRRSLSVQGIGVTQEIAFDPTESDYSSEASQLTNNTTDVITLIGDSESGGRFLTSLLDTQTTNRIVVNDAISQVDLSSYPDLDASIGDRIVGVAVDAFASESSSDDLLSTTPFATAAIDCVNLLALAVLAAQSDLANEFMLQVPAVSRGGSGCNDFMACRALINQSLNIDYNSITGLLDLDANGDPARANFITFIFDEEGQSIYQERLTVVASP